MEDKYIQQFKRGTLEMILLSLIHEEDTYGYKLLNDLIDRGGRYFAKMKEGTLYPILYRLEKDQYITIQRISGSSGGPPKKYYSITDKGREYLSRLTEVWFDYSLVVDDFLTGKKD